MASQFDIKNPSGVCNVCMQVHPVNNPCKYDVLVKNIHILKTNMLSLMKANKEVVDTARAFQQIIRDFDPNASRWAAIEVEYKKIVAGLRGAAVHSFAPSTDPNKPAPLVGVSIDDINLLLPPEFDDPAFEKWLFERNKDLMETKAPNGTEELQAESPEGAGADTKPEA